MLELETLCLFGPSGTTRETEIAERSSFPLKLLVTSRVGALSACACAGVRARPRRTGNFWVAESYKLMYMKIMTDYPPHKFSAKLFREQDAQHARDLERQGFNAWVPKSSKNTFINPDRSAPASRFVNPLPPTDPYQELSRDTFERALSELTQVRAQNVELLTLNARLRLALEKAESKKGSR